MIVRNEAGTPPHASLVAKLQKMGERSSNHENTDYATAGTPPPASLVAKLQEMGI